MNTLPCIFAKGLPGYTNHASTNAFSGIDTDQETGSKQVLWFNIALKITGMPDIIDDLRSATIPCNKITIVRIGCFHRLSRNGHKSGGVNHHCVCVKKEAKYVKRKGHSKKSEKWIMKATPNSFVMALVLASD